MEDNPFPQPTLDQPASKRKKRFIFLFFAIILILVLIFLGSRFMGDSSTSQEDISPTPEEFLIPTDEPTPSPEESVEPTEEAKNTPTVTPKSSPSTSSVDKTTGLDRADLTVTVQNGSGEKGAAGGISDVLKGLGYTISSTENADNFDYSDVTIQVKSSQKDYLAILKKDLAGSYTIGSATSDLPSSVSYDALVIIGK